MEIPLATGCFLATRGLDCYYI